MIDNLQYLPLTLNLQQFLLNGVQCIAAAFEIYLLLFDGYVRGEPIYLQRKPAEAVIYVHTTVFQIAINRPSSTFCPFEQIVYLNLNFQSSPRMTQSGHREYNLSTTQ